MHELMKALWSDESGQDMAEYALLLALVGIVVALTLPTLTDAISGVFEDIADELG